MPRVPWTGLEVQPVPADMGRRFFEPGPNGLHAALMRGMQGLGPIDRLRPVNGHGASHASAGQQGTRSGYL